ncbi:flavin-containing monooxygenase [Kineosporia succinea]|uniref:NADPH-dependent 2,4-dienoyl-CoA reductase/sulfur reductase-like enzyme n=1 Tax=Kineosporia succinea TaxID=84632 RepID=A0ABT9PAL0_9ACTN|nr:NAD(P)/FAD-dependent oxidoreductase [Kineosporia succinea]MDP9829733.1 NADPH-dependent 2,4-dienoyl-CoA reductase/sulfur reductase-like enzyme [Kineosporia succinea]
MLADVTIVGAGAAGLGVAAQLKRHGVDSVVLERGDGVGASWRGRYDRLRLHTTRPLSGLPGLAIPRGYGRWVRRDDLVSYLQTYAETFGLDVRTGTSVERIEAADDGIWALRLADGTTHRTRVLVVAVGYLHTPVTPQWPGRETWPGTIIHSSRYRNAEPFRGQDVLVVGSGNSGAEIATDLAEGGAASVSLAVRTPPHIVPRAVAGWPAQMNGILLGDLPERVFDPLAAGLMRVQIPDLRPYGLPRPAEGLKKRLRTARYVPLQDVGIVADIRQGRVRPVAAVQSFTAEAVVLADGTSLRPDAVVAATGYTTGLRDLLADPELLDAEGLPLVHGGAPARPGLYFMGYDVTLGGMLRQVRIEGKRVAASIARSARPRGAASGRDRSN